MSIVGWDNAEADPWRGILPRRDAWVGLCAPVAEAMRRRPVRLCMHRLGALRHSAFALDVYLWDAGHGAPGAPAPARLEVYRTLAEAPVSPGRARTRSPPSRASSTRCESTLRAWRAR